MSQTDAKTGQGLHALSAAYDTYLEHDEDEKNHFEDVCQAFRQHATFAMSQYANHQFRIHALPQSQKDVLPDALKHGTQEFHKRSEEYKDAAIRNQFCLDCILRHAGVPHSQEQKGKPVTKMPSDGQMSKVTSVLKSLVRDWSAEGQAERSMAYEPLIRQVLRYIPLTDLTPANRPTILVPGAGVGRLAFELTALGYAVQGNEFSLYMLLASDFILNSGIITPDRPLEVSPWIMESRNSHSAADRCRSIAVPDVDPASIMNYQEIGTPMPIFSMAAGDFVSIYGNPKEAEKWSCVCSCFFLDACPNIIEILQIVHKMLKPGGYLMNFGPLLYHWSGPPMRPDDDSFSEYQDRYDHLDDRYMDSVDLPYEDVKQIMMNVGFELVEEHLGMESLYTPDARSMQNTTYHCVNFVARKREPVTESEDTCSTATS